MVTKVATRRPAKVASKPAVKRSVTRQPKAQPVVAEPVAPVVTAKPIHVTTVKASVVTVKQQACGIAFGDNVTCGRLPAHHGEHRSTLFQPKAAKVAPRRKAAIAKAKPARVTKAGLAALRGELFAAVEDGSMTAGDALSKLAAYGDRLATVRRPKAAKAAAAIA